VSFLQDPIALAGEAVCPNQSLTMAALVPSVNGRSSFSTMLFRDIALATRKSRLIIGCNYMDYSIIYLTTCLNMSNITMTSRMEQARPMYSAPVRPKQFMTMWSRRSNFTVNDNLEDLAKKVPNRSWILLTIGILICQWACQSWRQHHGPGVVFEDLLNGIHSIRLESRENNMFERPYKPKGPFGFGIGQAEITGKNYRDDSLFEFMRNYASMRKIGVFLWDPAARPDTYYPYPVTAVIVEPCSDDSANVPVGGLAFMSPVDETDLRSLRNLAQGAKTVGNQPVIVPVATERTHLWKGQVIKDYKERLY